MDKKELEIEAKRIYSAIDLSILQIFYRSINLLLSQHLNNTYSDEELNRYYQVIESSDDLLAIEVASRYLGNLELLSKKFLAVIYLSETLPENQWFFINERSNFIIGFTNLMWGTIETIYRVIKGLWLLRIREHV